MKKWCVVHILMSMARRLSAVAAFLLATLPAAAQVPIFSDTMTIGNVSLSAGESVEGLNIFTIGGSPSGDPSQFGNYTVLTEPDGSISDVFGVVRDPSPDLTGTFLAYISDGEGGLSSVPAVFVNPAGGQPIMMAEGNGGPFDATMYLRPDLQGLKAAFQSDAEPANGAVPEPSTLALLCLGGFGLAGYAWRRRRQAV